MKSPDFTAQTTVAKFLPDELVFDFSFIPGVWFFARYALENFSNRTHQVTETNDQNL